jgi:hypothetical protein
MGHDLAILATLVMCSTPIPSSEIVVHILNMFDRETQELE